MLKPTVCPLVQGTGELLLVPIPREVYNQCEDGHLVRLGVLVPPRTPLVFALGWVPDGPNTQFQVSDDDDRERVREMVPEMEEHLGQHALISLYRLNWHQRQMLYDCGFAKFVVEDMFMSGRDASWEQLRGGYVCLADNLQEYDAIRRQLLR